MAILRKEPTKDAHSSSNTNQPSESHQAILQLISKYMLWDELHKIAEKVDDSEKHGFENALIQLSRLQGNFNVDAHAEDDTLHLSIRNVFHEVQRDGERSFALAVAISALAIGLGALQAGREHIEQMLNE